MRQYNVEESNYMSPDNVVWKLNNLERKYFGLRIEAIVPKEVRLNGYYIFFSYDCLRSPEEQEY